MAGLLVDEELVDAELAAAEVAAAPEEDSVPEEDSAPETASVSGTTGEVGGRTASGLTVNSASVFIAVVGSLTSFAITTKR